MQDTQPAEKRGRGRPPKPKSTSQRQARRRYLRANRDMWTWVLQHVTDKRDHAIIREFMEASKEYESASDDNGSIP